MTKVVKIEIEWIFLSEKNLNLKKKLFKNEKVGCEMRGGEKRQKGLES